MEPPSSELQSTSHPPTPTLPLIAGAGSQQLDVQRMATPSPLPTPGAVHVPMQTIAEVPSSSPLSPPPGVPEPPEPDADGDEDSSRDRKSVV